MDPIDTGNGVLYFVGTGTQFCSALSQYLEKNPQKMVITVCAENTNGSTIGHVVVVG